MTTNEHEQSDTKTDTRTDSGNGVKAKAEQLTHGARAKGAHLADNAGKLAHKASDAARHPERASTRLAVVPLAIAAGLAVLIINRIKQRRRMRNRVMRQVRRRLPNR